MCMPTTRIPSVQVLHHELVLTCCALTFWNIPQEAGRHFARCVRPQLVISELAPSWRYAKKCVPSIPVQAHDLASGCGRVNS